MLALVATTFVVALLVIAALAGWRRGGIGDGAGGGIAVGVNGDVRGLAVVDQIRRVNDRSIRERLDGDRLVRVDADAGWRLRLEAGLYDRWCGGEENGLGADDGGAGAGG